MALTFYFGLLVSTVTVLRASARLPPLGACASGYRSGFARAQSSVEVSDFVCTYKRCSSKIECPSTFLLLSKSGGLKYSKG